MSLNIDVDRITAVMIGNEWFEVAWREGVSTFVLDSYEFKWEAGPQPNPGKAGLSSIGFEFSTSKGGPNDRETIAGPLSAVQAVRSR